MRFPLVHGSRAILAGNASVSKSDVDILYVTTDSIPATLAALQKGPWKEYTVTPGMYKGQYQVVKMGSSTIYDIYIFTVPANIAKVLREGSEVIPGVLDGATDVPADIAGARVYTVAVAEGSPLSQFLRDKPKFIAMSLRSYSMIAALGNGKIPTEFISLATGLYEHLQQAGAGSSILGYPGGTAVVAETYRYWKRTATLNDEGLRLAMAEAVEEDSLTTLDNRKLPVAEYARRYIVRILRGEAVKEERQLMEIELTAQSLPSVTQLSKSLVYELDALHQQGATFAGVCSLRLLERRGVQVLAIAMGVRDVPANYARQMAEGFGRYIANVQVDVLVY